VSRLAGAARTPSRTLAYPLVLGLSALDAAAYSIIAPVLPQIASESGAGPATIGVLSAMFPVGILVGFPLAGRWVRRRDAESLLPASAVIVAVGALAFVIADAMPLYFLGRLVMGVGSGGIWIGVTYTTLERWPGCEYVCMSRVFAAYSAGALLGPAFGALGGIRAPFVAYAALATAGAVLAPLAGAPEVRRPFRADRSALRQPGFALAAAGIAFAVLALGVVDGVLPLHLGTELGQRGIAVLFVGVAVIHAAGATVAGRVSPGRALLGGVALVVVGVGVTGVVDAPWIWFAALSVAGIGVGFGETGSVGVLLDAVPAERSLTAMVVWSQLGILGYVAGPLLGGAVAEVLGFAWIGVVPLLGAALLVAVRWVPRRG
jgi:MFS family permease